MAFAIINDYSADPKPLVLFMRSVFKDTGAYQLIIKLCSFDKLSLNRLVKNKTTKHRNA